MNKVLTDAQVAERCWYRPKNGDRSYQLTATDELAYDYARWLASACENHTQRMTRINLENGERRYRVQCQSCGKPSGQWVPAKTVSADLLIPEASINALRQYEAIRYNNLQGVRAKHYALQEGDLNREYSEYLLSPVWRSKRTLIMRRANRMCEGCGENAATQVHHLTYQHIYEEFLFELVALCDLCHERIHNSSTQEDESLDA